LDKRSTVTVGKQHFIFDIHLLLLITALVLFGAFFMTMSFRTSHAAWIAWVGVFPLLLVIKSVPPVRAMLFGAVWGASVFALSLLIPGTESHIPHTIPSLTLLTIVPAVYAFAGGLLTRWIGFRPFILALGWFGVELGLVPLGIANGFLSHTQGDLTLMLVIEGSFGFGFLGFLVVFISALVLKIADVIRFRRLGTHLFSIFVQVSEFAILPDFFLSYSSEIILQPAKPRAPPSSI
jgi:apolipoprotein N-acyltransferase